jgi:Nitrogen Permease regulator of amino acid transport activity 3
LTVDLPEGSHRGEISQVDFCSIFVQSREELPIYHEVLVWLMRKNLLKRLHLRIRIFVSKEIKRQAQVDFKRGVEEGAPSRRKSITSSHSTFHQGSDHSTNGSVPLENQAENMEESSILSDPSQASGLERRWLQLMGLGADATAVSIFEQCAQRPLTSIPIERSNII